MSISRYTFVLPLQTVFNILMQAREMISKPEAWTKTVPARDANGYEVHELVSTACRFCSMGAIKRAAADQRIPSDHNWEAPYYLLKTIQEKDVLHPDYHVKAVWMFNDSVRVEHKDVLQMFDETLLKLQDRILKNDSPGVHIQ